MYLKSIEISGFKSFAEKTKLEFKNGITSIVGPNGSGKSNILDAILWVLGEQSYKNIRAKESSDVIFSGGKGIKAKGRATVSLYIDNSDNVLDLEYTEVKISRTIYPTGENEYSINGSKARLKDIQELFLDTGIGKNAYSIIGQGKVEKIILSNPKEIRSIVEEAAGIKKFKKRKEESEQKLKSVDGDIEKIEYVEEELLENLSPLKSQAEKAEKYNELKTLLNDESIKYYKKEHFVKNNYLKGLNKSFETFETELIIMKKEFDDNEKILEEINSDREKNSNLMIAKEEEGLLLKENIEKLINSKVLFTERMSNLKKEYNEKKETYKEISEKFRLKEKKLSEIKDNKEKIENSLEIEERKFTTIDNTKKESESAIKELDQKQMSINKEIMDEEIKKIKKQNEIEENSRKKNFAITREKKIKSEFNELTKESEILEKDLLFKTDSIKELKEEIVDKNQQRKVKQDKIEFVKKEIEEIKKSSEELFRKRENRERKIKSIKFMEENHEGFYKGVKNVLNSGISGIVGPLVSILEIPKEYIQAFEAGLGGSMQDIIVENSGVAKKSIEHLKKTNGGRASFLPLDTLKIKESRKPLMNKGVIAYAFDLVKYNPYYEKAVNFALNSLLVVETIDDAINIVKSGVFRGKIVTLKGEIISGLGKITGGESVRSGVAFVFDRREEREKLQKELVTIKLDIEDNSLKLNERGQLELELIKVIDEYSKIIESKNNRVRRVEEEKAIIEKERKSKLKYIDVLKFELEEEKKSVESFEASLYKNEYEKVNCEDKIKQLKKEIVEVSSLIAEKKNRVEEYSLKYSDNKIELARKRESVKNSIENIAGLEKDLAVFKEDLNKYSERVEQLQTQIKEIEANLIKFDNDYEKLNEKYQRNRKEFKEKAEFNKKYESKEKEWIVLVKDIENNILMKEDSFHKKSKEREKILIDLEIVEEKLSKFKDIDEYPLASDEKKSKENMRSLRKKIDALGVVNPLAIDDYKVLNEKVEFISIQKRDLKESKLYLENLIKDVEIEIVEQFSRAFEEINSNFSYMCRELLNESKGEIRLSDEKDVLSCGIEIMVKFKNKKYQSLTLLSGGEKSMIAVAFIMAMFMYRPSPFTFFDEIEAALDEANTKRLLALLKRFTDNTQFMLITHNKETMRSSDVLYGVTMNKEVGVSKVVSIEI